MTCSREADHVVFVTRWSNQLFSVWRSHILLGHSMGNVRIRKIVRNAEIVHSSETELSCTRLKRCEGGVKEPLLKGVPYFWTVTRDPHSP